MIFSSTFTCGSFDLLTTKYKKFIIHSLNFLQSYHCLWISAANVISGTVHCKGKKQFVKKVPLRGIEKQGSLSKTFSTNCYTSTVLMLQSTHFCQHKRRHIAAATVAERESFTKSASHLLWRGTAVVTTEGIQKKQVCVCLFVIHSPW